VKRCDFIRLALVAPWALRQGFADDGVHCLAAPLPNASAASGWLLQQQSPDGAWRSQTYGAFRDGRALTPIVMRALARLPGTEEACRKGSGWLLANAATLFDEYPVHLASAVLEAAEIYGPLGTLAQAARQRLFDLQCPRTGGWSYSTTPPAADGALSPIQQANLAATTMALDGLQASRLTATDPRLQRALPFIQSCQNFGGTAFDDGGFFQLPDDPARNKAGIAGKDARGVVRYQSYLSATADGLRALIHAGEIPGSPRLLAARAWLECHAEPLVELRYYSARSLAKSGLPARHLLSAQRANGCWLNSAGEMREDCPIVATALALEAL
jgi:hypothetical protein